MYISVDAIVINMAVLTTLFTFVNAYPNHKLLSYTFREQMADILPSVIRSAIMALGVLLFSLIPMNIYLSFGLQIAIGVIIYLSLALLCKNKELLFFIDKFKTFVLKK